MSKTVGQQIVCDRCGKTIFLKKIRDVDHDGGFSPSTAEYEVADKWEHQLGVGDLCPWCAAGYHRVVEDYVKSGR